MIIVVRNFQAAPVFLRKILSLIPIDIKLIFIVAYLELLKQF